MRSEHESAIRLLFDGQGSIQHSALRESGSGVSMERNERWAGNTPKTRQSRPLSLAQFRLIRSD